MPLLGTFSTVVFGGTIIGSLFSTYLSAGLTFFFFPFTCPCLVNEPCEPVKFFLYVPKRLLVAVPTITFYAFYGIEPLLNMFYRVCDIFGEINPVEFGLNYSSYEFVD